MVMALVIMASIQSPETLAVTARVKMALTRSQEILVVTARVRTALTRSQETLAVTEHVRITAIQSLVLPVSVSISVSAVLVLGIVAPLMAAASMAQCRMAHLVTPIVHQIISMWTEMLASLSPEDGFMKKPLTSCLTEEHVQHIEKAIKLNLSSQIMVG